MDGLRYLLPCGIMCFALLLVGCDSNAPETSEEAMTEARHLRSHSQISQTCIGWGWGGYEVIIAVDTLHLREEDVTVEIESVSSGASFSRTFTAADIDGDEECQNLVRMNSNANPGQEDLNEKTDPGNEPIPDLEEEKLYQITINEKTFTYMSCSKVPSSCPGYVVPGGQNSLQDFAFIIDDTGTLHSIPFANAADADQLHLPYNEGIEAHWTHGSNTWQIPTSVRSICQDLGLTTSEAINCENDMGELTYFLAPGAYTQTPTTIEFPSPTWLGGYRVGSATSSVFTVSDKYCEEVGFDTNGTYSYFPTSGSYATWNGSSWITSSGTNWRLSELECKLN